MAGVKYDRSMQKTKELHHDGATLWYADGKTGMRIMGERELQWLPVVPPEYLLADRAQPSLERRPALR